MPPQDAMIAVMRRRATTAVAEGEPIIPEGPIATTQDMQEFKTLARAMGYDVEFGQNRAVTRPALRSVQITGRCCVGVLSDEFFHVWNNQPERRGSFLADAARGERHRYLGSTFRLSGSSNDREFHQFELENFTEWAATPGGVIPGFVWRTFSVLQRK